MCHLYNSYCNNLDIFRKGWRHAQSQLIIKLLLQLGIIIVITYIGTEIQKIFHLPLAGSIVGLFLFYLLLQFKIVPLTWVEDGANFY